MGRRMKSTKSGKYINPTDQARKEARKRELKKNKKQRLIVRVAVLKGKDPYQIISDLERLDRMEFDFYNPPQLNEKVLKDKRRKLKDTWDRIVRLYIKEDKDKYQELKRMETDYNQKRAELIKQYEAIKSTQEVNLDEIPLPSTSMSSSNVLTTESIVSTTKSILKDSNLKKRLPPGCPPGLPPSIEELLSDIEDIDDDVDDEDVDEDLNKKICFADQTDDKDDKNESDLHKFLQEIEQLSSDKKDDTVKSTTEVTTIVTTTVTTTSSITLSSTTLSTPTPQIVVRPQPPPMLPPMHQPGQILRMYHPPQQQHHHQYQKKNIKQQQQQQQITTIEARPQLRNLSADSTKFMPLALRIRRDDKHPATTLLTNKKSIKQSTYGIIQQQPSITTSSVTMKNSNEKNSKDDAYEQFMKEMDGLI